MSRKKGAAVAIIAVVAAIGGLAAYANMPRQEESNPPPVLTAIDRSDGPEETDSGTTIAENEEQPAANASDAPVANNTVTANNTTIVINKPVYRNNTVIYQPVTINLENYRTTINQHAKGGSSLQPADDDKIHSITIHANRIRSEGWSAKFADDRTGMFTAVYDINGDLIKTGYADERGFTVKGLEDKLYFVFPADCSDCSGSKSDIMFRQWEDGSKDRPRLVPADSEVTASYRLVVPEKPRQVPLTPPPGEIPPEEAPPANETETAAEPEITLHAQNASSVYGWVQVSVQVENMTGGFDKVVISVYAPNGTLYDSFSYSDRQGFFMSRQAGEGDYRIVATYDYGKGAAKAEVKHSIRFATPEFANLAATEDNGTVRLDGMLKGGLAGENITIAIHDHDGEQLGQYGMSFGTRPVFSLFIAGDDAGAIFNKTGNYTFTVTHVPTGVQGNATLFHDAGETATAGAPVNVSDDAGRSERSSVAAQGSNVYLVWQDDASGQHEIMFAKSNDSGETFSEPVAIGRSEEGGFSLTPDIAVADDNVYVAWADYDSNEQSAAAFVMSNDSGETFGNKTVLGNYTGEQADPQITLFKGDVYVSWISGSVEEFTGDLMLARSPDGAVFEAALVAENATNVVMAGSNSNLYLAWEHYPSGDVTEEGTSMFGTSPDGVNFEVQESPQNMTVYSIATSDDTAYVAGSENGTVTIARSSGGSSFNSTAIENVTSPVVAASGNNVYAVWSDEGEIFIAASADGGKTFGEAESIDSDEGFWPAVAAAEKIFVTWTEDSDIMIVAR